MYFPEQASLILTHKETTVDNYIQNAFFLCESVCYSYWKIESQGGTRYQIHEYKQPGAKGGKTLGPGMFLITISHIK